MKVLQSLFYSALGTFVSLISGLFLTSFLRFFIFLNVNVHYTSSIPYRNVIFCTAIGILIPVLSAIFAYSLTLLGRIIEALSTLKIAASSFRKQFKNLLSIRFSTGQLVMSSLFLFYGVTFFYFVPRSFFFYKIETFLLLMSFVILLMFLGVAVLSTYLQLHLQLLAAKFFFCVSKSARKLKTLVEKNIRSNRPKNSQIFLLLSLVMLVIIFIDSSFRVQLGSVYTLLRIRTGTDLRMSVVGSQEVMDAATLRDEIEKFNSKYRRKKTSEVGNNNSSNFYFIILLFHMKTTLSILNYIKYSKIKNIIIGISNIKKK